MSRLDIEAARESLVSVLKRKFSNDKQIVIYGAGNTAELNAVCFGSSKELDPQYFIDDTPNKHGTQFCGRPVVNFEEAHTICKSSLILICCMLSRTRNIMLNSLQKNPIEGAEFCTLDEYVFCQHSEDVLRVYDMLEDDFSKATYANMILARMGKVEQNQELTTPNQYFAVTEFKKFDYNEIFVDCGAYVGDTIECYLMLRTGSFQKIFAFEPGDASFQALTVRMERLKQEWAIPNDKIQLVQAGTGEENYHIQVSPSSDRSGAMNANLCKSSKTEDGGIRIYSIDEYFSKQPISFLKADIESFEWNLLAGAKKVIQRDRPKLALCIYHNPYDMYRIALKVKEICPDYRLAIRQHYCEVGETVLYAY